MDPRYEWREMNGTIVFRPVAAWNDVYDPMFRLTPAVKLDDVRMSAVIAHLAAVLEAPELKRILSPTAAVFRSIFHGSHCLIS
jgi:hypothetical protein